MEVGMFCMQCADVKKTTVCKSTEETSNQVSCLCLKKMFELM